MYLWLNTDCSHSNALFPPTWLHVGDKPSLPFDDMDIVGCPGNQECFLAGDVRVNEQTGIIVMHTIWLREHNRIATKLEELNPEWSPAKVFLVARHIVGGELQAITYNEYLPAILGETIYSSLIGSYLDGGGYNPTMNPSIPNAFAAAAFRFGHSQIQPFFDRLDENFQSLEIGPLKLMDAFFNPSQYKSSGGTDPLLRGMLTKSARRVDEFLNSILTNHLFQTNGSQGMDLASLNIQRGRDHGIPPYMVWKRWAMRECNLSSEFQNQLTLMRLLQTYGSLETVDLWVGGLSEERLPGSILGATFACIFARTFGPIRHGDRFYYENDQRLGIFTAQQRAAIGQASISRIICDNADNIQAIQQNAFRTNQPQIPCSDLPKVDLSAWRETCSMKIKVNRQDTPFNIIYMSSLDPSNPVGGTITLTPGETKACIPFICPTTDSETRITVRPQGVKNGSRSCSVNPNSRLPENTISTESYYSATVNDVSSRAGLYRSSRRCLASGWYGPIALDFTCTQANIAQGQFTIEKLLLTDENTMDQYQIKTGQIAPVSENILSSYVRELLDKETGKDGRNGSDKISDKNLIAMLEHYIAVLKENPRSGTYPAEKDQDEKVEKQPEEDKSQLLSELEKVLEDI